MRICVTETDGETTVNYGSFDRAFVSLPRSEPERRRPPQGIEMRFHR